MYAFQIAECMQPRTMRYKTLAGADSPLKVVKTFGGLLVLLQGLEQKQDCDLPAAASHALPNVFVCFPSDDTRWQAKLA